MAAPVSTASTAYAKVAANMQSVGGAKALTMKSGMMDFQKTLEIAASAYNGKMADLRKYDTNAAYRVAEFVTDSVSNVRDTLIKSEDISAKALVKQVNMSDVVMAVTNADIALQTIIAVRDKVISSYMDVIKMQI